MKIKWISANTNGDFYIGHIVRVTRGIHSKEGPRQVDEVMIVGIPKAKMQDFCVKHGIVVEYDPKKNKVIRWYEKGGNNNGKEGN